MKKFLVILLPLIFLIALAQNSTALTASACWTTDVSFPTTANYSCDQASDDNLLTNSSFGDIGVRIDNYFNYTFEYGLGDQTNGTVYFLNGEDLESGYFAYVRCINASANDVDTNNNAGIDLIGGFSSDENVTFTIHQDCLFSNNVVIIHITSPVGDDNQRAIRDFSFVGYGTPPITPTPSATEQQYNNVVGIIPVIMALGIIFITLIFAIGASKGVISMERVMELFIIIIVGVIFTSIAVTLLG